MRKTRAYYRVDVLKDGTIVSASPSRKPSKSMGMSSRKAEADPDGCISWRVFNTDKDMRGYTDWARGMVFGAIVNRLNLRRTLRADVEPRLDRIERKLDELLALFEAGKPSRADVT